MKRGMRGGESDEREGEGVMARGIRERGEFGDKPGCVPLEAR